MPAKILLVDDEPAVLAAYERSLRKDFEVDTAIGGELGLKAIREHGPYATVISDMRMPGMSGTQFLTQARQAAPDTVRMLLTGYTDWAPQSTRSTTGISIAFSLSLVPRR